MEFNPYQITSTYTLKIIHNFLIKCIFTFLCVTDNSSFMVANENLVRALVDVAVFHGRLSKVKSYC